METVYPNGTVMAINKDTVQIQYGASGIGFIPTKEMPVGIQVGDHVRVTLEIKLKKVEIQN